MFDIWVRDPHGYIFVSPCVPNYYGTCRNHCSAVLMLSAPVGPTLSIQEHSPQVFFHKGCQVFVVNNVLLTNKQDSKSRSRWLHMVMDEGVHLGFKCLTVGPGNQVTRTRGPYLLYMDKGVRIHVTWMRGPPSRYMDKGSTFTLHGRGVHLHVTWTRGPPSRYMDKGSTFGLYIISVLRGGPDRAFHINSFHTGVGLKYR